MTHPSDIECEGWPDPINPLDLRDIFLISIRILLIGLCFYFAFVSPFYWLASFSLLCVMQLVSYAIGH